MSPEFVVARSVAVVYQSAAVAVARSWYRKALALRDRLLMSRHFQERAAALPLTRPIARRRARALFDLCAGFVYSQVLLACVRLRVLEHLAQGPLTLEQLSRRLQLSADATQRLLAAATSLRLTARRGTDSFGLGDLGAAALANPGVLAMVEHHPLLYRDLQDPVALLSGDRVPTELGTYWAYTRSERPADLEHSEVAAYTRLMSLSQAFIAREVLDSYSLRRHRCLLDVGGGDGSFLVAAAEQMPHLQLRLFDLPAVAACADRRFRRGGLQHRARAAGGDLFTEPLPKDADVASLIRVIHDHDDEAALHILRAVRNALPPTGVLLLAEPMSATQGAETVGDAYFGFYLLAMGQGRPRTRKALEALLRRAGFCSVRCPSTRMPILVRVLVARVDTANVN